VADQADAAVLTAAQARADVPTPSILGSEEPLHAVERDVGSNGDRFDVSDFTVDWERRRVRCPEGQESTSRGACRDKATGRQFIRAGFNPGACRACSAKLRCNRTASRRLSLHPRAEHKALTAARKR
jgi:hypothetical protein